MFGETSCKHCRGDGSFTLKQSTWNPQLGRMMQGSASFDCVYRSSKDFFSPPMHYSPPPAASVVPTRLPDDHYKIRKYPYPGDADHAV